MGSSKQFLKHTKFSKYWILKSDKSGLLILFCLLLWPVGRREPCIERREKESRFSGKQKHDKTPSVSGENQPSTSQENSSISSSEAPRVSASRRKLNLPESIETPDQVMDFDKKGYRLIDIAKFCDSLSEAHVCDDGKY